MLALFALKDLYGACGYRTYSTAIGRCPTTFNRSVSDASTVTSRLVLGACGLLSVAKESGLCPHQIVQAAGKISMPRLSDKTWLQETLEQILGEDAIDQMARHLGMSSSAVRRAIGREGARHEPHFKVMTAALLALRQRGRVVTLDTLPAPTELLKAA